MKIISLLVVWSFLPVIIASSLLAPTPVFTGTTTIPTLSSSSAIPFLIRKDWRNGNPREGFQASGSSETSEEDSLITTAPSVEDIQLWEKYHQTTYWSCVTRMTLVHCGWHEPILAGGTEIAGASCGSCNAGRVVVMAAGAVIVAGVL
ncbi:uncharacterized protein EAF01_010274 [Botrytis porri]|uniref:Uncharacterized protein n=1 Tax=Botrytis porri TaxID=87229 RepID=A0A4Z1KIC1_9HELO|nr:uncharacterized protein EAF01_010274 [Botrytis porri]KAF7892194.1 hypothetical protein EAF01_010274 [Botrytis porri]TGO85096.1 hypothetical protein BPOR_0432g00060 [Botrytis porri]